MITEKNILEIASSICSAEKLDIINFLGQGTFKVVFSVKSSQNVKYALKILKSTELSERIHREFECVQRCRHQNIANIYKFKSISYNGFNVHYFIEEILEGGNLSQVLKIRRLNYNEILSLGSIFINILNYLHLQNIVHRDIKPENIMFRKTLKEPVLVDFGIVRDLSAESLTQSAWMRGPGTPFFSAPEQLTNKKHLINWRTDQFSLGIVLSISAFNVHPYHYPSNPTDNIVERVANYTPKEKIIRDLYRNNKLSCIDKMTELWPVERYRHPKDLLKDWENQRRL